jgi:hypothetical protein
MGMVKPYEGMVKKEPLRGEGEEAPKSCGGRIPHPSRAESERWLPAALVHGSGVNADSPLPPAVFTPR